MRMSVTENGEEGGDQSIKNLFSTWENLRDAIDCTDAKSCENQSTFLKAIQNSLNNPSTQLMKPTMVNKSEDFQNVFSQLNFQIGASEANEKKILKPTKDRLFEWAKYFPLDELKVVIMSLGPSFQSVDQLSDVDASGLAYQPLDQQNVSYDFQQVIQSIKKDNPLFVDFPDYNLNSWIDQKVLLLNCYTSGELIKVKKSDGDTRELNFHGAWLKVTRALVDHIFWNNPAVIFILVGTVVHEKMYENFLRKVDENKERIILVAHPMEDKRFGDTWEFGQGLDVCNWKLKKRFGKESSINWMNLSRWATPREMSGNDGSGRGTGLAKLYNLKAAVVDGSASLNQKSFFDAMDESVFEQEELFPNETFENLLRELDKQIESSNAADIRPIKDKFFEFTKAMPIQKVRVVIIGNHPAPAKKRIEYNDNDTIRVTWEHLEDSGLAFQPNDQKNVSEGFKGIIESIKANNPLFIDFDDFNLNTWIEQNVLLLNCFTSGYLTGIKESKDWDQRPVMQSHSAWLKITKAVIAYIFTHNPNSVFIMAGNTVAEQLNPEFWETLKSKINNEEEREDANGRIIKVTHPSIKEYGKTEQEQDFSGGLDECNKFIETKQSKVGCINWLKLSRW